MRKSNFKKLMMRAATLALSAAFLSCAVPMLAQDNTAPPPPPQQQDNTAPAPSAPRGRMRGEHQLDRMTHELNLSPDQVTQIRAIHQDTRQQMVALRDDSSIAQADKRSKMLDIRKESQDKVRAVLNDEQKTKYDAMIQKMRENRRGREGESNQPPPEPPPPPPPPPPPQ